MMRHLLAKGFDKASMGSQIGIKISEAQVWTYVSTEFTITSGQLTISIWNDGNAGNWMMADNLELYKKDQPQVNYVKNGDFEPKEVPEGAPEKLAELPKVWQMWSDNGDFFPDVCGPRGAKTVPRPWALSMQPSRL